MSGQELHTVYENMVARDRAADPLFAGCPDLAVTLRGLDAGSLGEAESHAASCPSCQRLAHAHFRQCGPGRWLARYLREGEAFPLRAAMERYLPGTRYGAILRAGTASAAWLAKMADGVSDAFTPPRAAVSGLAFAERSTRTPFTRQVTQWDENRMDVVLHEDESGELWCTVGTDRPDLAGARFEVTLDRGPDPPASASRVSREVVTLAASGRFFVGAVSFGSFAELQSDSEPGDWRIGYRLVTSPEETAEQE